MGLLAKDSGGGTDFEPLPTGTHLARCITVCDLGLQPTTFGTKEKVYLGFEVPRVRVEWEKDGQKHEGAAMIGNTYTLSIHAKSILGQHLVSWRGQEFTDEERAGFDVFKVLGAPCMISVIHNVKGNNTYANITAIMRVPQGTVVPAAEGELIGYTACDSQWSGTLDKLPEWLKKKALEGQRQSTVAESMPPMPPAGPPGADLDEWDSEIPF